MEIEDKFEKIRNSFLILLLLLVSLVIYFPSLSGKLFFDDEYIIVRNSYVQDFSVVKIFTSQLYAGAGQSGTFYRPLQPFFHSLIYQFFKTSPLPHHLFSLLLHFGSAVLLFFLLRDFNISKLISFFSALLFVVHPINTSPVSYVSCLVTLLDCFFFYLLF